ncbi:MAG: hypothetical protein GWN00_00305 [Aliifodinibius sp.]|nr:hypothetical protein [Fodinibius sp.]NIV09781.1 hypothetical protein [Fodinibius sp.]NIY23307.1 hypothetical protein [Fodinibius sp.]
MESGEFISGNDTPQDEAAQDNAEPIEGEVIYGDDEALNDDDDDDFQTLERNDSTRNIIIAVVILLFLICCCCFLFVTVILAVFWPEIGQGFTYAIPSVARYMLI